MSGETGVENRESMAVTVEMAMLKRELEEKKARLLKELELIEGELTGFEEEGLQSPMVLED